MRVGREHDGGYVVSRRTITGASGIVGLGINDDWSFEQHCVAINPTAEITGIDGSVSATTFRRNGLTASMKAAYAAARLRAATAAEELRRARHWFRTASAFQAFFARPGHRFIQSYFGAVGGEGVVDWQQVKATFTRRDREPAAPHLFVKMDIEGEEYRTLPGILEDADSITGLVIEFHDCDLLWERFTEIMDQAARDFAVVHVHGNNCVPLVPGTPCPSAIEVSLANRSLLPAELHPSGASYPLDGLDMPNLAARPDYPLVFDDE